MTIATSANSISYTGDGVSLAFAFPYPFITTADLKVYVAGVLQTVGYSVSGTASVTGSGTFASGTVTFVAAPASLAAVLIYCDPDLLQSTSLPPNDPFPSKTVERMIDKLTLLIQRLVAKFGNAITFPPGDTASGVLGNVVARASRILGFDALGNVTTVVQLPSGAFTTGNAFCDAFVGTGAQTAFTLSNNPGTQSNLDVMVGGVTQRNGTDFTWTTGTTLTFSTAPPNGVAIQARYTNAFPIGSTSALSVSFLNTNLDAYLKVLNPIRKYGVIVGDGVTDDSGTFLAAIASGDRLIDARGVNSFIGATLNFASNQVWGLDGMNFQIAGAAFIGLRIAQKDRVALLGSFSVTGDGSTAGTSIGIDIVDSTRVLVDMPVVTNVRGWGIYVDPGSSTTARGRHASIRSPIIESCYYGYSDVAGTGAEYCTLENPRITLCTAIGMQLAAGNTLVVGGHIVDNIAVGLMLVNGGNHGHGIITGVNINHNGTYNIQAVQVTLGFTFANCHTYQGDVWFDRCKGMQWDGGHFDPAHIYNYKDGSSGMNRISHAYFPGSYGPIRTVGSNDGHDQLIIDDTNWGPGTYALAGGKDTTGLTLKDPSTCYVQTQRDAGTTLSTPTGTPTLLTFSTANYLFDRRGVQSAGTFTIPADQAGIYHVDADLLFAGTGMSVSASFVEMKVNGVTKKEMGFPSINSTTKLQIQGSFDFYFNGSDAVTFVATITGTTPTFGDGSWPSNVTLRRIA